MKAGLEGVNGAKRSPHLVLSVSKVWNGSQVWNGLSLDGVKRGNSQPILSEVQFELQFPVAGILFQISIRCAD